MRFNNTRIIYAAPFLVSMLLTACGGGGGGSSGSGTTPDTTLPTVSSTSPANSATGVGTNAAITATFSENVDATTISTATFTLNNGVTGAVTYSGTTATFTPSSNLAYATAYTATITTGVKDTAGNAIASAYTWSFTTGATPDTTPPTVSSTSPANSATVVGTNAAITATFSENVDATTISTATFTLNNGVTGAVTYSGTTATFTPSSNLAYATAFTATITTGVKDTAGNAIASAYTWSFTTGATPDTTPPTVSSTSPANSATGVAVNAAITATFSENMDTATISTATITLNNGVTGAVTYSGTTATFTPSSNLAYSTTYTATITTAVKDAAGNAMATIKTWAFTTGTAPDTTPPTVSSTSPANSATGVAVNAAITATFSENMDAATISTATFTLDNGVTGSVTYSGTTATFTPSTNLAYSTAYTVTISTAVKDAAGNAMAATKTWAFTTGAAPDTTPPTISSTSPSNNATGVAVNAAITATFSENMDAATISTATFALDNGVTGAVNYSGTTATFTPTSNLAYSTTYVATITTTVKDAAGNAIAAPYTWTFTTGTAPDTIPPTISSVGPANSATTGIAVNAAITATFSENMDAATISTASFTLDNGVTGAVTYSGTTATFTPSSNLAYSTVYTATITTGVKDAAGNAMASNYTWSFSTGTVPGVTSKLNDTGITASQCYQQGSDVLVVCSSAGATWLNNAQDGMAGRDANPATNTGTDGKLGFSFTSVTGGCVQDNVTGLMWEVKTTDGGLRDWAKTYTNYDSTTTLQKWNGSAYVAVTQAEIDAATNSVGFKNSVNAQGLCGYSDWRLPSIDELQSIVDYGVASPGPTVDASWFPNTQGGVLSTPFWSASPYVGQSNIAWVVYFNIGYVSSLRRDLTYYVRLVRAGQSPTPPRYTVSADGQEVTDNQTNLIWRRCVEGMVFSGGTCTGAALPYKHEAALQLATTQASSTGVAWRLPNVKELASIADKNLSNPAIDSTAFPTTPSSFFWSASPLVGDSSKAWTVIFTDGSSGYSNRCSICFSFYVRLVRDGQ